jgi:glutaryl-CoA dehydrogenase
MDAPHPTTLEDASFDWRDPLMLGSALSDDERMVQAAAARFAKDVLAPRVQKDFRNETAERALFVEMGARGLLGMTLPEAVGGSGLGYVAYGLAARQIESVDSGYRSAFSVQNSLVLYPIFAFGSPAQQHRYLPMLGSGAWVGCFGLTEPDHGSDPGAMTAHAVPDGDGFRLNGTKTWITNAPIADLALVWARLEGRVRGFLVERDTKGFSTPAINGKFALRASSTGQIVLADAYVPATALLPGAVGLRAPFACLNRARYGIAWGTMGAAEACWTAAHAYVLERTQFGRQLAATQLIQKKLADMQTEIALGLNGALRLGRMIEKGIAAPPAISLMKRNNCGKALEIARAARDMLGANGISDDYPVIRHLLNLEAVNTYEGTHDVHALILGRAQTGLQAFQ